MAEQQGVAERVTLIEGTLAKAFGVMGGYVTGPALLMDVIRSFSDSFIFTTSLCPHLAAGALAAVQHLKAHPEERSRQKNNVARLKAMLQAADMPVPDTPSHILPLIIGDAHLCRRASDRLLTEHSIYVQPINYPTVPRGQERLRITPTQYHSEEHMVALVTALVELRVGQRVGQPRRVNATSARLATSQSLLASSLSQGFVASVLPARAAVLEVIENVPIDPQRDKLFRVRD
jgi:5-aminolevulinate synthase